ncbi:dihydrolipoyl dehydrogenase family protein [Salinactinospora qingdaonensis]|uniref:NAD(P)/FAD-dependent oxidoreductase n=1 Tax=Salinactinospora qingdaonensis TaxID=702744 RepID=A0ABP7GHC0_9ACTN
MTRESEYDVIVIGAGSTGENVADRVRRAGLTTVVVERALVGGECSYWACMPSKALLRPPAALHQASAVDGAREAISDGLSPRPALARRDEIVSHWHDDSQVTWVHDAGIDLVRGQGRLVGERLVEVTSPAGEIIVLTARHAVALCTGSRPLVPPPLAPAQPWGTHEATSAQQVPDSLIVVGGGVAGCELAWAWHCLGAQVTMVVRGPRLLAGYEPFAGDHLRQALHHAGIDIRTATSARQATRDPATGYVSLTCDSDQGQQVLTAAELLAATGRAPTTDDLGLDSIGLDPAALDVDDTCQVTGVDEGWLYAVGDVNGRAMLTHMGKYQARACGEAIAARAAGTEATIHAWSRCTATADHHAVPQVVFTEPEVAAVGRTEDAARAAGLRVRAVEYPLSSIAGAVLYARDYSGHAKIVVDDERQVLLGCTLVGSGAGELIHAATVAVVGEVPLERLWHAVPAYPTMSEIWLRLLETYGL